MCIFDWTSQSDGSSQILKLIKGLIEMLYLHIYIYV